ncbi:MAG: hypothetical protein ABL957_16545 [Parvularculaceae bacterium]
MTARQLSFFKTKQMGVSRDLYLENGWKMPRGIVHAGDRNPTNFSLAEWQHFKCLGTDPRTLKAAGSDRIAPAPSREAFRSKTFFSPRATGAASSFSTIKAKSFRSLACSI